tara:strand:+ start:270 stop:509 length:240 start_codon:yes stop_codon:yes gene_type:complete
LELTLPGALSLPWSLELSLSGALLLAGSALKTTLGSSELSLLFHLLNHRLESTEKAFCDREVGSVRWAAVDPKKGLLDA